MCVLALFTDADHGAPPIHPFLRDNFASAVRASSPSPMGSAMGFNLVGALSFCTRWWQKSGVCFQGFVHCLAVRLTAQHTFTFKLGGIYPVQVGTQDLENALMRRGRTAVGGARVS